LWKDGEEINVTINVLISCANDMMGQSVERLCRTQADLDVVNARFQDPRDWSELFKRFQPDVLIFDEADNQLDMPSLAAPFALLERFPDLRVIEVSEQANQIFIYQRRKVLVRQVADLFSVVRDQIDES